MAESSLSKLRQQRIDKLERLRSAGIDPYPSVSRRTHSCRAINGDTPTPEGEKVSISGRLMLIRRQGALTFAQIQDQSGRVQAVFQRDSAPELSSTSVGLSYPDLKLLDVGDFIQVDGVVAKTKRGEISVFADNVHLLAKGIRPLPEKHKGLSDREAILRRRYLHATTRPEIRDHFARVAQISQEARRFLWDRDFIEFATPVLQCQYGGGTANPFRTHVDALNIDAYLSISHELYLKRLIASGYEKVFTIGKYFRNEGIDKSHHPEFSMIETMTAFENYTYNMDLVEDLFRHIATKVFGKTEFVVSGQPIDLDPRWRRVSMRQAVIDETGIDFLDLTVDEANSRLAVLGIDKAKTPGLAMVAAFEAQVEQTLVQPTLLFDHPIEISPLAKPSREDPRLAERFEIFIAGLECGDNWTEQNDPQALLATWLKFREEAYLAPEDTHPVDYDFIEALEYGMPPTTGIGPGVERMAMIFSEEQNIDDVIFFPLMKPVVSDLNRELYGTQSGETPARRRAEIHISVQDVGDFFEGIQDSGTGKSLLLAPAIHFTPVNDKTHYGFGHVAVHGLLPGRTIVVSGYKVRVEGELQESLETSKFAAMIEEVLAPTIRRIPGVADVTLTLSTLEEA